MGQVKVDCTPVAVELLAASEIRQMFNLFEQYYDCVSYETFCKDLFKKDQVILAREHSTWAIKGFTTLKFINVTYVQNGRTKTARGLFSGDTIVAPEYWGKRLMNGEFAKVLLREKMKRPFDEFYWFLISKGYKTYLLLTNNFTDYYPRYDKPTPTHIQSILDGYAQTLYPEAYEPSSGLLRFQESLGQLKASVAPIGEDLLRTQPNVAYFQTKNPNWPQGDELVCIGVINWRLFAHYAMKSVRYLARGWTGRARPRPVQGEA